ncbi:MAG: phosphodiesterase [Chromatiales bacterium]|nr:phosphodiesterase [Chromatiales bacterium]
MRLVQISDLHMVPAGQRLHGLDPNERLRQCVADINQHAGNAQACIATGDLADRGETGAYEAVRTCLDELNIPYWLLIGNHDRREHFVQAFPEVETDANGFVQYSRRIGDAALVFLDTVDPGSHAGRYCEQRCEWLASELHQWRDFPTYVFMHHPPFPIGLPGLDVIRLLDSDRIESVLRSASNLRHIFFGHVHRPVSGCWHGVPFSALPATNHQVALDFDAPPFIVYSHERPGYALIDISAHQTVVHVQDFSDAGPRRTRDDVWEPPLDTD